MGTCKMGKRIEGRRWGTLSYPTDSDFDGAIQMLRMGGWGDTIDMEGAWRNA